MKVLIDIPDKEYNRIKGKTEVNYSEMWIAEGAPLDGLTNGEVIQKMFPQMEVDTETYKAQGLVTTTLDESTDFRLDWWNGKWGE